MVKRSMNDRGDVVERIRKRVVSKPLTAVGMGVVVALAIGFAAGTWRFGPTVHSGMAQSAEGAISVESDGWFYGIPMEVAWTDRQNSWHERGRPDCLPPSAAPIPIRFSAVEVTAKEVQWRQVVWVDCRATP
jgi:hypothetical protein